MRGDSEMAGLLRRKMPMVKYKERVHDMHAFFCVFAPDRSAKELFKNRSFRRKIRKK